MKLKCAVIGSGISGIASAIRLAAKGCAVDVYEANSYAGGKIKEQHANGYRFDMGPSVFMLPNLVDELFELCGKNPKDYFTYSPIETSFKYFFEDGSIINAYADIDLFAKEIEQKTNHPKVVFDAYLKDIEAKYNITKDVFIENSLHVFSNFFTKKMAYGIANFNKIDSFKTMNEANQSFFKDARLVQLFNNYATYIGSNPFTAPATLNIIQHLE
ncbi:MAG: NAD(P)-binding protein, partial [Bacteroidia bacterium]